ncbi:AbgT family transporter [Alteraurantiacibacter buctensis]|uniref:AbgT family transporter n=1 Tax=Alteraurantiacibacter buctensis TaxID=1503981 RepID=A0A844YR57_9SPHN|nr:AbgT family transporter [Alteraurantiacibacter buctensis]MXO70835.1 AbgT family transporter [Alteraurantiacibacter buctensis]
MNPPEPAAIPRQRGFLGFVERAGNLLPEPTMIFVWLIGVLVVLSIVGAALGWSASLPYSGETPPEGAVLADGKLTYRATSLLAAENVTRLLTEMPRTMAGFAPLGLILTIMLGAAVAERSGLLSALIRASLRNAPRGLLTPLVALVGMVSHHASDAAYLVYVPLAALVFATAGRHPLAGLAAAFAAVSGGYAGNITPGQIDVLLFGFTQEAARIVEPGWVMNPAGNWWFILAIVVLYIPAIWFITDRVIEPRLGQWSGAMDDQTRADLARTGLEPAERKGLRRAGLAALLVIGAYAALTLVPGYAPLFNAEGEGTAQFQPLLGALVAGFFLLFLLCGIAFGSAAGTVRSSKDVTDMMQEGIRAMAPYIVFVFFAAHFVAMFNWSRLGPILAIDGAEVLSALALPAPLLLVSVQMLGSFLDLFIGSASAKWSALAPVVVPMFMLLGISPEMTTAAYRMGDSYTNIMTPLMSYFPLILAFARRWDAGFGVGSLLALMLPYALTFMVVGVAMVVGWVALDLPLGPGAQVFYQPQQR